jgi:zinc and cadmium transporter
MTWLWVAIAVALDGAVGLVGGLLPESFLQRQRPVMLGFATGAVAAVAMIDLMPDAYARLGAPVLLWLAGTILVLAVIQRLFAHRGGGDTKPYTLLGSDALHNFTDGMAIAAAFVVSLRLGAITSLAVIMHEVPEEISLYAISRAAGFPKKRALIALTLVQLTAGIGAAATWLGASLGDITGIVLAIAAGTFVYIALELLPEVLRRDRTRSLIALAVGALIVALAS